MNTDINLNLYDLCPSQVFIKLLDCGYKQLLSDLFSIAHSARLSITEFVDAYKAKFDSANDILEFTYVISAYVHICNLIGGL